MSLPFSLPFAEVPTMQAARCSLSLSADRSLMTAHRDRSALVEDQEPAGQRDLRHVRSARWRNLLCARVLRGDILTELTAAVGILHMDCSCVNQFTALGTAQYFAIKLHRANPGALLLCRCLSGWGW